MTDTEQQPSVADLGEQILRLAAELEAPALRYGEHLSAAGLQVQEQFSETLELLLRTHPRTMVDALSLAVFVDTMMLEVNAVGVPDLGRAALGNLIRFLEECSGISHERFTTLLPTLQ